MIPIATAQFINYADAYPIPKKAKGNQMLDKKGSLFIISFPCILLLS